MIVEQGNMSLGVILLPCGFYRIIPVTFPSGIHNLSNLRFLAILAMSDVGSIWCSGLSPVFTKLLVTPITFLSLLPQYALKAGHSCRLQDL